MKSVSNIITILLSWRRCLNSNQRNDLTFSKHTTSLAENKNSGSSFNNFLNNYFSLAVTTIIFILLSTITFKSSLADGDTTYISTIKNLNNFLANNTLVDKKALNIPILTVMQPAGMILISSAILGLFLNFFKERYIYLKPLIDYVLSFIGLIIASPLLLAVAIIIKITSSGPVLYMQERVGRNGRLFKIIKFRSMHVDAESKTGPVWATGRNDTRVTPIGRFLRRTHIDELPQIINVLKGDMSIIGPRPERPHFVEIFKNEIHGYTFRMTVKPGITGLAQCYHRYDETIHDVERKLRYDALYIRKMCWTLDLRIIWHTVTNSLRVI